MVPVVCDRGFAMPCESVFLLVCLMELLKMNFFRKLQEPLDSDADAHQSNSGHEEFLYTYIELRDCKAILGLKGLQLETYQKVTFVLVLLSSLCSWLRGSAMPQQVLFSVVLARGWCFYYYHYIEYPLSRGLRVIVADPRHGRKQSLYLTLICSLWVFLILGLFIIRKITQNRAEEDTIERSLEAFGCSKANGFADRSLYYGLMIVLPVFVADLL